MGLKRVQGRVVRHPPAKLDKEPTVEQSVYLIFVFALKLL